VSVGDQDAVLHIRLGAVSVGIWAKVLHCVCGVGALPLRSDSIDTVDEGSSWSVRLSVNLPNPSTFLISSFQPAMGQNTDVIFDVFTGFSIVEALSPDINVGFGVRVRQLLIG
jgi:hypothetical protein